MAATGKVLFRHFCWLQSVGGGLVFNKTTALWNQEIVERTIYCRGHGPLPLYFPEPRVVLEKELRLLGKAREENLACCQRTTSNAVGASDAVIQNHLEGRTLRVGWG